AVAAKDAVIACAAVNVVVAGSAVDKILSAAGGEAVIPAAAVERVIPDARGDVDAETHGDVEAVVAVGEIDADAGDAGGGELRQHAVDDRAENSVADRNADHIVAGCTGDGQRPAGSERDGEQRSVLKRFTSRLEHHFPRNGRPAK